MSAIHPRGVFVTATDTGVGKTYLAGAILAALTARGVTAAACKPILTGTLEQTTNHPLDHEVLATAGGLRQSADAVVAYQFGSAVSPHLAAAEHGVRIDRLRLLDHARTVADDADVLVVEGAGGVLVPINGPYLMRDFFAELGLPVLVAARTGLGTINHTLQTLECVRAAGLSVLAVVLTPWPEHPSALQESNRDTIAELGDVDVVTLARANGHTAEALAAIGAALPLDRWLGA